VTTTVTGALKEGLRGTEHELGVCVGGGKGAVSRKTPAEIALYCERLSMDPAPLVYASRMSAKVDSAAVQDGYQLYHHAFFFTSSGGWCVVQQGMHDSNGMARRYHWLASCLHSFVNEPHAAICAASEGGEASRQKAAESPTLNLVASESDGTRAASATLAREKPGVVLRALRDLPLLSMPRRHSVLLADVNPQHLDRVLLKTYERAPENFETLLGMEGVGAKTLRALALASEIIYGTPASMRDPARFSFAHGGKDGFPYPVDVETYDVTVHVLREVVNKANIDRSERVCRAEAPRRVREREDRSSPPVIFQTIKTTLPITSPDSSIRCASAACASGKVAWTIGRTSPRASSGHTFASSARAMAPFSSTVRARRVDPVIVRRFCSTGRTSSSDFDSLMRPIWTSRPF
jgi:hypothetical protein